MASRDPNSRRCCPKCGGDVPEDTQMGICPKCVGRVVFNLGDLRAPAPPPRASLASQAGESLSGSQFHSFGDYELLEKIGRGGMGVVWRARQISLDRLVALKMILAGHLATQAELDRFQREAQAAAKLDHPHIVAVHEVGQHDGQHYFSMRLVEGESLAARLSRTSSPLPPRQAAQLLSQVVRAVHHAHQRGILHRDLKPANILLDPQGEPHLTDFGLAKSLETPGDLTRSDSVLGTPYYTSPEQAQGRKDLTTATDLYSLGAVLYHLLTGSPPFQAGTAWETLRAVVEQEPRPPSTLQPRLDRDLETICLKCLEKDPARRYATADALANDLERWLRQEPILARSSTGWERGLKWVRRRPAVAALTGVACLAILLGLGGVIWQWHEARAQLRASLLAQAHANRLTAQSGRRFRSLEILGQAAGLRPGPDLRDEAIACLAVTDLRVVRSILCPDPSSVSAQPDDAYERYAVDLPGGAVSVRRWSDQRELLRLPPVGSKVDGAMRLSHSGQWLAVRHQDGWVRLWNLNEPRLILTNAMREFSQAVDFRPDDQVVAVADGQKEVRLHETATGRMLRAMACAESPELVVFSPNGQLLAVATVPNTVLVFEANTGTLVARMIHPASLTSLAWHPDGRRLATASHDRQVRVWNAVAGQIISVLAGHGEEVHGVAFHPNGELLLSGGFDGLILWRLATAERLLVLPGNRFEPRFGRAGDRFCVKTMPIGSMEVCELAAEFPVRSLGDKQPLASQKSLAFSRHGRWLACTDALGLRWFDTQTGAEIGSTNLPDLWQVQFDATTNAWCSSPAGLCGYGLPLDLAPSKSPLRLVGQRPGGDPHGGVVVSADGTRLAVGAPRRWLLLRSDTGDEIAGTPEQPTSRCAATLNPDGTCLATQTAGVPEVLVWHQSPTQPALRRIASLGSAGAYYAVPEFLDDGRALAIHFGPKLTAYATSDWRPLWSCPIADPIAVLACAPHAQLLAVRTDRRCIRLLETETGTTRATLQMPDGAAVAALAWSADGASLAAASASTREIFLWDLRAVRRELAFLDLDWTETASATAGSRPKPEGPVVAPTTIQTTSSLNGSDVTTHSVTGPARAVDISRCYNLPLAKSAAGDLEENTLASLADGLVHFDGMEFAVQGRLQLRGKQTLSSYPARMDRIPVGRACRRLHFLCATVRAEIEGMQVGRFLVRLGAGNESELTLRYDQNICDWWSRREWSSDQVHPVVAWEGNNAAGKPLRLYRVTWENPKPGTIVDSVSFVSELAVSAPFLLAICAEE